LLVDFETRPKNENKQSQIKKKKFIFTNKIKNKKKRSAKRWIEKLNIEKVNKNEERQYQVIMHTHTKGKRKQTFMLVMCSFDVILLLPRFNIIF
jgi:hypothetical protein